MRIFSGAANGQALVTLLFFMVISIVITSGALVLIIDNTASATRSQQGNITYYGAEGGIENAILRIIRNPSYTGETIPIGVSGSDIVTVSSPSGNIYYATSTATFGNFVSKVQAVITNSNNKFTVSQWKEMY